MNLSKFSDSSGMIVRDQQAVQNLSSTTDENNATDDESSQYYQVHKYFDNFTYWNREILPSQSDKVQKWYQWIEISKQVELILLCSFQDSSTCHT